MTKYCAKGYYPPIPDVVTRERCVQSDDCLPAGFLSTVNNPVSDPDWDLHMTTVSFDLPLDAESFPSSPEVDDQADDIDVVHYHNKSTHDLADLCLITH